MNPEVRLEMLHLQLTNDCNLNCWFCGQRKSNQKIRHLEAERPMQLEKWMRVIQQIEQYRLESGVTPAIIIWGGEAILSECFEPVVKYLADHGFPLGMVTNGTLLHQKAALCRESFQKIYISVDGSEPVHDSIRGPGSFQRIKKNIELMRQGNKCPELVLMTVVTKELLAHADKLWEAYRLLKPDEVLLQEMIGLTAEEIRQYKSWTLRLDQNPGETIGSWKWPLGKPEVTDYETLDRTIDSCSDGYPVRHLSHGTGSSFCLSPFRHLHIQWDGEVSFCTDFTHISIGNVKNDDVLALFYSSRAKMLRKEIMEGNCIACSHCSWIGKEDYLVL